MIMRFIRSQLIEVIEWTDNTSDTMVYRFPVQGNEIKMGAQLTVRESQAAVFVNEGQIADVFVPGRYQLSTENMPVLTKLKSWKYGFNSPFKAEVYFVNTKQFTHQKWGTANPIIMRDQEFGMIRLRAFGTYGFRVVDPAKFLKELFGTRSTFGTEDIAGQLRGLIVSSISDLLAESQIQALDLSMNYDELSTQARFKLQPRFGEFGLDITLVAIENISLPKEVEEVLDKRTSMGILGDLNRYAQYQSAEAIREAARNEGGGMAGAGVGLGAGAALGNMMAQSFREQQQPQQNPQSAPTPSGEPSVQTVTCPGCQNAVPATFRFCGNCGQSMTTKKKCGKCSFEVEPNTRFCPECGQKLE
jgi:membrane protease subunit (stomatin/prohibitin family)